MQIAAGQRYNATDNNERETSGVVHCLSMRGKLNVRNQDRRKGLLCAREVGTRIGLMREGRLRRMIDAADITATELESLYLEEMGQQG